MVFDNLLQDVLLFLGVLALLPLLTGLGVLIGRIFRIRSPLFPTLFPFVIIIGIVGAGSLYLDRAGSVATGTVIDRRESIHYGSVGGWNRFLTVFVKYQPVGAPGPATTDLQSDAAHFDRLHVGDRVPIRYVRLFGFMELNRYADQDTYSALIQPIQPILFWAAATFVAALMARYLFRAPASIQMLSAVAVVAVALFVSEVVAPVLRLERFEREAHQNVQATIEHLHLTDHITTRRHGNEPLLQPYYIVALSLTPPGGGQPVVAVDVIDQSSLSLKEGQKVSVTVLDADPRQARLMGGTRTYLWKNALIPVALGIFVVIVVIIGAMKLARRQKTIGQPMVNGIKRQGGSYKTYRPS